MAMEEKREKVRRIGPRPNTVGHIRGHPRKRRGGQVADTKGQSKWRRDSAAQSTAGYRKESG